MAPDKLKLYMCVNSSTICDRQFKDAELEEKEIKRVQERNDRLRALEKAAWARPGKHKGTWR